MTKQEELREFVAKHLYARFEAQKEGVKWDEAIPGRQKLFMVYAGTLLYGMASQGCVLKVELDIDAFVKGRTGMAVIRYATEPLIKGKEQCPK